MSVVRVSAASAALGLLLAGSVVAQDPVPRYPDNYRVLVENERVRVLDFRLRKGDRKCCTVIRRTCSTCSSRSRSGSPCRADGP